MSGGKSWEQCLSHEAAKGNAMAALGAEGATRLALKGRDAGKVCGLCEKSLYLAVRRGELKCVRIGRAVRYRLEDLQAWINSKVK